ncbi:Piso0_005236 [Millerozyma farinosa CBS 7064]|uniref:Piso0_005236 protein n=1 Tax=Pichia sorbitophila (strain ATCC MYA-4447 / BCRC 22081 / CBS 7064 / NBRC 10061 / NRRL Y-12695) TaxID=559304 RepID=G8Y1M4_PICSO|nr:Piso0_005236 [Millerozyma farinosa CBS 7064]
MTNYQPVICCFASKNIPAGSSKSTLKDDTKIHNNCHLRKLLLEVILALSDPDFLHLIAIALKL